MARLPRKYSAPLVLTFAAFVPTGCGGAVGGDPKSEGPKGLPSASGGSGGGTNPGVISNPPFSGGGTGGQSGPPLIVVNPPFLFTGGAGGSTGGAGGGGGVVIAIGCDAGALSASSARFGPSVTLCDKGAVCSFPTECASGARAFEFECLETFDGQRMGTAWALRAQPCERATDHCLAQPLNQPALVFSCSKDFWQLEGAGGNPPAPCPAKKPIEAAPCEAGVGFGADRQACGYQCSSGGWTVMGCFANNPEMAFLGNWVSDGACSRGGSCAGAHAGGASGSSNGNTP